MASPERQADGNPVRRSTRKRTATAAALDAQQDSAKPKAKRAKVTPKVPTAAATATAVNPPAPKALAPKATPAPRASSRKLTTSKPAPKASATAKTATKKRKAAAARTDPAQPAAKEPKLDEAAADSESDAKTIAEPVVKQYAKATAVVDAEAEREAEAESNVPANAGKDSTGTVDAVVSKRMAAKKQVTATAVTTQRSSVVATAPAADQVIEEDQDLESEQPSTGQVPPVSTQLDEALGLNTPAPDKKEGKKARAIPDTSKKTIVNKARGPAAARKKASANDSKPAATSVTADPDKEPSQEPAPKVQASEDEAGPGTSTAPALTRRVTRKQTVTSVPAADAASAAPFVDLSVTAEPAPELSQSVDQEPERVTRKRKAAADTAGSQPSAIQQPKQKKPKIQAKPQAKPRGKSQAGVSADPRPIRKRVVQTGLPALSGDVARTSSSVPVSLVPVPVSGSDSRSTVTKRTGAHPKSQTAPVASPWGRRLRLRAPKTDLDSDLKHQGNQPKQPRRPHQAEELARARPSEQLTQQLARLDRLEEPRKKLPPGKDFEQDIAHAFFATTKDEPYERQMSQEDTREWLARVQRGNHPTKPNWALDPMYPAYDGYNRRYIAADGLTPMKDSEALAAAAKKAEQAAARAAAKIVADVAKAAAAARKAAHGSKGKESTKKATRGQTSTGRGRGGGGRGRGRGRGRGGGSGGAAGRGRGDSPDIPRRPTQTTDDKILISSIRARQQELKNTFAAIKRQQGDVLERLVTHDLKRLVRSDDVHERVFEREEVERDLQGRLDEARDLIRTEHDYRVELEQRRFEQEKERILQQFETRVHKAKEEHTKGAEGDLVLFENAERAARDETHTQPNSDVDCYFPRYHECPEPNSRVRGYNSTKVTDEKPFHQHLLTYDEKARREVLDDEVSDPLAASIAKRNLEHSIEESCPKTRKLDELSEIADEELRRIGGYLIPRPVVEAEAEQWALSRLADTAEWVGTAHPHQAYIFMPLPPGEDFPRHLIDTSTPSGTRHVQRTWGVRSPEPAQEPPQRLPKIQPRKTVPRKTRSGSSPLFPKKQDSEAKDSGLVINNGALVVDGTTEGSFVTIAPAPLRLPPVATSMLPPPPSMAAPAVNFPFPPLSPAPRAPPSHSMFSHPPSLPSINLAPPYHTSQSSSSSVLPPIRASLHYPLHPPPHPPSPTRKQQQPSGVGAALPPLHSLPPPPPPAATPAASMRGRSRAASTSGQRRYSFQPIQGPDSNHFTPASSASPATAAATAAAVGATPTQHPQNGVAAADGGRSHPGQLQGRMPHNQFVNQTIESRNQQEAARQNAARTQGQGSGPKGGRRLLLPKP